VQLPPSIDRHPTPATVDKNSTNFPSSPATFGSRRLFTDFSPQIVADRPTSEIRLSGAPMPNPEFLALLERISAVRTAPTPIMKVVVKRREVQSFSIGQNWSLMFLVRGMACGRYFAIQASI
jgi:hypothetical protein